MRRRSRRTQGGRGNLGKRLGYIERTEGVDIHDPVFSAFVVWLSGWGVWADIELRMPGMRDRRPAHERRLDFR